MPDRVLQLDSRDNVLIALTDLSQGEQIEFAGNTYTLVSGVPAKHKFATQRPGRRRRRDHVRRAGGQSREAHPAGVSG